VKVLSRNTIAPRQQVVLVQVGQRVIVAADSGGQLSTLAQISDPEEVAQLLSQIDESKSESGNIFASLLTRNQVEAVEPQSAAPTTEELRGEIGKLMAQVRTVSQGLRKND